MRGCLCCKEGAEQLLPEALQEIFHHCLPLQMKSIATYSTLHNCMLQTERQTDRQTDRHTHTHTHTQTLTNSLHESWMHSEGDHWFSYAAEEVL